MIVFRVESPQGVQLSSHQFWSDATGSAVRFAKKHGRTLVIADEDGKRTAIAEVSCNNSPKGERTKSLIPGAEPETVCRFL